MRLDKRVADYREEGGVLPPFQSGRACLAAALDALAPPQRLSVTQVAARRMVNVGGFWAPWSDAAAPMMREPADLVTSRRFRELVFVGPARSLKTQALVLNVLAHMALAQPRTMHVVQATQTAARALAVEDIGPTIRNSPELASRLMTDDTFAKTFAGGGRLTIGWPVAAQLRGRTIPLVVLTDLDAMPDNVDGEGDVFGLAAKRTQTLGSAGMTIAESSPSKPITDPDWTPKTAHEAPPARGILGLYNGGTRARWTWPCDDCGDRFEPVFAQLSYDAQLPPQEAGAAAVMTCPHCGGWTRQGDKARLNAAGAWLHEGPDGPVPLCELARAPMRASYWLAGPAAPLATYAELVERYETARRHFEATGDETGLQRVTNVDLGAAYLPRAARASEGLTAGALRALATPEPWGVAPADAAFLVVVVDVQARAFVVHVEAWRPDMARALIDRFRIERPPAGAPRASERAIDPARYAEDWRALDPLFARAWPVAGGGHALRPVAVVWDAGGAAGVTERAYAYWRLMRRDHGRRARMVRGVGGLKTPRAVERAPETAQRGRKAVARDVRIIFAGTDRLKDELLASALREDDGPRAYRVSAHAPAEIFEELAAERRGEEGWRRRSGAGANEALDGAVYSAAAALVLGAERIDWRAPPAWAAPGPQNAWAAPVAGAAPDHAETPAPRASEKPTPAVARRPRANPMRWR